MRKFALIAMLIFGLATPAMADVDLAVGIQKDVAIVWDQNVAVDVVVELDMPPAELDVVQAAIADAFLNQTLDVNDAILDEKKKVKDIDDIDAFDQTVDSVNGNSGIVGVNQASGSLNNQGNTVAVSVVTGTAAEEQVVEGLAYKPQDPKGDPKKPAKEVTFVKGIGAADQKNLDNILFTDNTKSSAVIEGSINDNAGITQFNQSPGNFNNQANAVAVAAGLEGVDVALAEADLGQLHTGALLDQINYTNSGLISASISGNSGITHVNQSSGNMNNQGNVVSIAAVKGFAQ